jgi:hypothetical protein
MASGQMDTLATVFVGRIGTSFPNSYGPWSLLCGWVRSLPSDSGGMNAFRAPCADFLGAVSI